MVITDDMMPQRSPVPDGWMLRTHAAVQPWVDRVRSWGTVMGNRTAA
ncbi:hypothetical protein ACIOEW_18010 [Streptomyces sp. NPDC087901]